MLRRMSTEKLNEIVNKEKNENERMYANLSKVNAGYSTFEKILMSKMTKYNILDAIIPDFEDKNIVNILLDLNSIINTVYNPQSIDETTALVSKRISSTMLASYILNMVAHYKNYFITKKNKAVQVFVYYSFNDMYKDTFKVQHNEKYSSETFRVLNNYIKAELKIVEDVLMFVPFCYIVNTNNHSTDLVPMLVELDNRGTEQTVIFGNNKLSAINMSFSDNVSLVDVKGIDSKYYDKSNIHEFLGYKVDDPEFFANNLHIVYSLLGYSKYNINKAKKITANKILSLKSDISAFNSLIEENSEVFNTNMAFLNFKNRVVNMDSLEKDAIFYSKLIDPLNIVKKVEINTEYFSKYPVNIDFLFKE